VPRTKSDSRIPADRGPRRELRGGVGWGGEGARAGGGRGGGGGGGGGGARELGGRGDTLVGVALVGGKFLAVL
jgi:hypothetical protein